MADSATFRIRRVKCRDEMGGKYREKFGNDEIQCAVFSADLRGSTRNSGRINIYDNFDDGDEKVFNPPREVVTLDLAGATMAVDLSFTVLLIESQVSEGDGLQKAWEAWVKVYEESLKGEITKRRMSPDRVRAVAQPGYLRPSGELTDRGPRGLLIGTAAAEALRRSGIAGDTETRATGTAAATVDDTDLMDPNEEERKKEEEKSVVGGAFLAALGVAAAMFVVKFGGAAVSALLTWARDKMFPPVAIKATIDAATPAETVPPFATGVVEFRGHDGIYEMEWDVLVR